VPAWLADLADVLYHRRYQPLEPRWVDVPKKHKPGETRRLGILAVRDRVVAAACKQILEPILEPTFADSSFGFRAGRSVQGTLAEALRRLSQAARREPYTVGVSLDVADCFGTLDHALLSQALEQHIADKDALHLLTKLCAIGGTVVRSWWRSRTCGLIQGSALSPLLCNLALHPLDASLQEQSESLQNRMTALRYADNLLLLAQDRGVAWQAIAKVQDQLARLRQKLGTYRPAPVPLEQGVDWLGVRLFARRCGSSARPVYGYIVPDHRVRDMLERLSEMTVPPSDRLDPDTFHLSRWIVSINDQLREWTEAYRFADNIAEVFRAIDDHARRRLESLLCGITGLRQREIRELAWRQGEPVQLSELLPAFASVARRHQRVRGPVPEKTHMDGSGQASVSASSQRIAGPVAGRTPRAERPEALRGIHRRVDCGRGSLMRNLPS
jgi:retron-type reverse transcriptase